MLHVSKNISIKYPYIISPISTKNWFTSTAKCVGRLALQDMKTKKHDSTKPKICSLTDSKPLLLVKTYMAAAQCKLVADARQQSWLKQNDFKHFSLSVHFAIPTLGTKLLDCPNITIPHIQWQLKPCDPNQFHASKPENLCATARTLNVNQAGDDVRFTFFRCHRAPAASRGRRQETRTVCKSADHSFLLCATSKRFCKIYFPTPAPWKQWSFTLVVAS